MIAVEQFTHVLHDSRVEFIVIGGIAGRIHGSARVTQDFDIVYSRSDANIQRLVAALSAFNPYPRGAPPNLPFAWDARTVKSGLNITLKTTIGSIDILGEVVGGGRYEDLVAHCDMVTVFGRDTLVVSLPWLIHLKRAAGRPRDFEAIAELELLMELGKTTARLG